MRARDGNAFGPSRLSPGAYEELAAHSCLREVKPSAVFRKINIFWDAQRDRRRHLNCTPHVDAVVFAITADPSDPLLNDRSKPSIRFCTG